MSTGDGYTADVITCADLAAANERAEVAEQAVAEMVEVLTEAALPPTVHGGVGGAVRLLLGQREAARQALTDVLPSLLRQLQLDREQSYYWQERWTDGRDGEIEAWLLSLIDFDWTPANVVAAGSTSTTTQETPE